MEPRGTLVITITIIVNVTEMTGEKVHHKVYFENYTKDEAMEVFNRLIASNSNMPGFSAKAKFIERW